ncbi:MAG: alpha/beta hydrolase [Acidimicrobiales bacterium]
MQLKMYTIDGRGEPDRLLFLIHGFSANEFHLAAYGPLVDPDARFLVAAPRGPIHIPADGAAWWDIDLDTFAFDYSLLPGSLQALDRAIDDLCAERGMDRSRAVIGGFSQGAALSLALAFRRGAPSVAGVVCLSGFRLDDDLVEWDVAANAGVPVFVGHGDADPFLGLDRRDDSVAALEAGGVHVSSHTYPIAHDISLEELGDLRNWLAER